MSTESQVLPHKKAAPKYSTFDLCQDEVEELKEAFKIFDENNTGFINPENISSIFSNLGYDKNNTAIMSMLEYLKYQGTGEGISFEQFLEASSRFLGKNTPEDELRKIFLMYCDSESNVR